MTSHNDRFYFLISFIYIFFNTPLAFSKTENDFPLKLWYSQPARIWEEALPLGNGQTGAMVFGGIRQERFQLNDHTLWSGGPENGNNAEAANLLPILRQAVFNKEYKVASETWKKMQGPYSARYLPLGDLYLEFDVDTATHYKRTLDINKAITSVEYQSNGTHYQRSSFISHPAKVLVIQLKADKKGKLNVRLRLDSKLKHNIEVSSNRLMMKGQAPFEVAARNYFPEQVIYNDKGIRFEVQLGADLKGGTLLHRQNMLEIRNADEVTLYLSESTNFSSFDQNPNNGDINTERIVDSRLKTAMQKGFERLKQEHIDDYTRLFNRVNLKLTKARKYESLPTDERIKNFTKHGDDFGLQELYYQFGRYLLIASSRPGSRPANLQGLWNDQIHPPWGSNYTININTEMNYWLAENTNLSECHEPLLSFIRELAINGTQTAKINYGINEGWMAHHNSDLWAKTSPTGHFDQDRTYLPQAFCWQMGGAWLSTHLWDHYQYQQDTLFLKQAYPLMKGAAQFLVHWLVKDPETGYLITVPSTSPENHFSYNGEAFAISKGTAMDLAIVRKLFSNVIKASEVLSTDFQFRSVLQDMLTKIYPYQIGRYGQIQEWFYDLDNPNDTHRHISQLFGLFPGNEIDPILTPDLANASKVTLEHRGDISTGWSMAWKINWWARLRNGDRAYSILQKAFNYINPADKTIKNSSGGGTYPNLFDAHPPFQIDGNFGATAGMTELLLQSNHGIIDLLPALPKAWEQGHVQGIKARGNFTIDIFWQNHKIVKAKIKSMVGGNCTLRSKEKLTSKKKNITYQKNGFWYMDIITKNGETILLHPV